MVFDFADFATNVQSVCGISIVKDYYNLEKFNVMVLANKTNEIQLSNPNSRIGER